MLQGSLKPYLARSAALHAALLVLVPFLLRNGLPKGEQTYRIDFIGGTDAIMNRDAGGPAAPLPKPRTDLGGSRPDVLKDPDAFDLSRKKTSSLPKPSILSETPSATPAAAPTAAASSSSKGGGQGGEAGTSVAADLPDFPYPWYLSQIRGTLWDRWSDRMPAGRAECVVFFSILRDGSVADLKIETSSGSEEHDYAAMSAVQEASPFPPLPRGLAERFLKVHVSFRSR